MKRKLLRLLMFGWIATMPLSAAASYQYVCEYVYMETSYTYYEDAHMVYDRYSGDWILAPAGYYSYVTGTWQPLCGYQYFPDPPPPPPGGGTPPGGPPVIGAPLISVSDVDATDPQNVRVNLRVQAASTPGCDFNLVRMFVGGASHETLDGAIPYAFTMGHIMLGSLATGSIYVQFDASGPCGDFATAGFTISRASGTRVGTNIITITYFDLQQTPRGPMVVPVSNAYDRTFAQDVISTSFDVTANSAPSRFQLTRANDAIRFGDPKYWPGSPTYGEQWSATGTSIGNFSETMTLVGFSFFDGTMSYNRPQLYGPAFGFEPTVAAEVSQFQWYIETNGWVPCFLMGARLEIVVQ